MLAYARAHWRGELSLARSYWINGVALSAAINVSITLLEQPIAQIAIESAAIYGLAVLAIVVLITAWQLIGIWRSATRAVAKTGKAFWPGIAKVFVIVGLFGVAGNVLPTGIDLFKVLAVVRNPNIAEYTIERFGDTDLLLTGAINGRSVDEVIYALGDPSITILRVNSHGGLIDPAFRLARYIRDNEIFVMAEGQCISACVLVLAASPDPAIYPETRITFHRGEPTANFVSPEMHLESMRAPQLMNDHLRELGIPDWAIETAGRQEFWTPTLEQQIEMGLVAYIFDTEANQFIMAEDYCALHNAECVW